MAEMEDNRALQLLELLGEYANAYGADTPRELTVRELASDLMTSLPDRYAGRHIDRVKAQIERVFGG